MTPEEHDADLALAERVRGLAELTVTAPIAARRIEELSRRLQLAEEPLHGHASGDRQRFEGGFERWQASLEVTVELLPEDFEEVTDERTHPGISPPGTWDLFEGEGG